MGENYSTGSVPQLTSTERQLLVKLLLAANSGGGGGGGGSGMFGVGSPQGVVTANQGTTYLQTDTGSFWAKQTGTGNTGWLELIV